MKKIGIVPVAFGAAGKKNGAELGAYEICTYTAAKKGVFVYPDIRSSFSNRLKGVDCLNSVMEVCNETQKKVSESLMFGNKTFIIGGDHSIALGSISAAAQVANSLGKSFGVIYLDAHGDINTMDNSETKNIHGMTLAASMNIGDSRMTSIVSVPLSTQKLLLLATRSLDWGEEELILQRNIKVVDSNTINGWADDLSDRIKFIVNDFIRANNIDRIHLSIDIDAVDPKEAPATGVPENNGISTHAFYSIISEVLSSGKVFSVDLVEYNPLLDIEGKTSHICREAVDIILSGLAV